MVDTDDGKKIQYQILILAYGAKYTWPIKSCGEDEDKAMEATQKAQDAARVGRKSIQRIEELNEARKIVERFARITIVGAGLVGVELAAELVTSKAWMQKNKLQTSAHHQCQCILRGRQTYVLPGMPEKARAYAMSWLQKHGVHFIGDSQDTLQQCQKRAERAGDELVIDCTGAKPLMYPRVCDSQTQPHFVRVNRQLRSEFDDNIFAIGDCADIEGISDTKNAFIAELSGQHMAHNIWRLLENRPLLDFPTDLTGLSAQSTPRMLIVSLGAHDGIVVFNDSVLMTGRVAAYAKKIIERTKLQQYRGEWFGSKLWELAEPSVFVLNRLYRKCNPSSGNHSNE